MVQEFTAENFHKDVIASPIPVLADFWSPGCAPCRRLAPILDEIASQAEGRIGVGKVNAWEQPTLAARYRISAVPTILFFQGGIVTRSLVGYQDKRKLLEALEPALNVGLSKMNGEVVR